MQQFDSKNHRFPMHLEVRDLRLVVTIAQAGTLTNAARLLHLTQSTLSHHLAELENRINEPLFYRAGRRLVATPVGDRFRKSAEPMLEQIHLMENQLACNGAESNFQLRFATECYTTYPWFARIAKEFKLRYPQVELKLVTEATAQPIFELERRLIDIAVTCGNVRDKKLQVQELFSDELVALVSREHPWARTKRVAIAEFRHVHLLTYSQNPMDSDFVREVLLPAGIVPQRTSGIQLTEGLFEFARAGLGVAVVARWAALEVLKGRDLVSIRIGRGIRREWKAVWMQDHEKTELLKDFAKLLSSILPIRLEGWSTTPRRRL
jgi:LysR family transcriptional regulator for metE and metH